MNDFTLGYQIRLLALFCRDRDFFLYYSPVINEFCFTIGFPQWVYSFITTYFKKFSSLPSQVVLEQSLRTDTTLQLLPEEAPMLDEFFGYVLNGIPAGEETWVRESAHKFAATKQIKITLNEQGPSIDEGDFDKLISALRMSSNGLSRSSRSLKDQYVFSLRNLEEIYMQGGGVKTGVGVIDNWVGGLFKKELTIVLADTNVGKSLLMCYIGGQILRQGKRVLHVTLEMSLARTLIRYFATLGDLEDKIQYNDILHLVDPTKIHEYSLRLRERYEGQFHIEELPPGKGTVEDLYRFVDKYQNPDVLIVDYLDLLAPPIRRDNKRFELGELTTAVRGLSVEGDISVLTPTQTNRAAHNRRIIGFQFVAEDYEKMRIADTVVGMGQTLEDALRHEVVLMLAKSRNTVRDKAERYIIDYSSMSFRNGRPELLQNQGPID